MPLSKTTNSGESSSDDDLYDNYEKLKVKAAKGLWKTKQNRRPIAAAEVEVEIKKCRKDNDEQLEMDENDYRFLFDSDDELLSLSNEAHAKISTNPSPPNPPSSSNSIIIESDSPTLPRKDVIVLDDGPPSPPPQIIKNTCTINIRFNGSSKMFIQDMDDPIKRLIEEYIERTQSDSTTKIMLFTKQLKKCNPMDTPRALGFVEGSTVELDAFEDKEQNEEIFTKTIRIKYQMKGKKSVTARIPLDIPFSRLKQIFCQENDLDPGKIQFIFDSSRLNDTETPASLELENDDCIDVYECN